jgi:hypothetical protein
VRAGVAGLNAGFAAYFGTDVPLLADAGTALSNQDLAGFWGRWQWPFVLSRGAPRRPGRQSARFWAWDSDCFGSWGEMNQAS